MRLSHVALRVAFAVAAVLGPASALARSWQGVTPGTSQEGEVTSKFGQPSTQGKLSGRSALVYRGDQAIAGTRQAQFFVQDGVVVEVVVFPASPLDRETVEGTYGHPTHKAFTDDFRTVWRYKSGVSVYFGKDGTVDAISFRAPDNPREKEPPPAPGKGPPSEQEDSDARGKP
ncbi:MAG TPA: hypothetical protein VLV17_02190 [Anaeromyxobacteraceae bacterium]|nr:hypothetical protein [Anaeromyxobacteraceae bacterium]